VVDIPYPWNEAAKDLVKLFTLEGRHSNISGFHFPLFSHFKGKMQVNLPYFLFHSMDTFIYRNRGLMLDKNSYQLLYKGDEMNYLFANGSSKAITRGFFSHLASYKSPFTSSCTRVCIYKNSILSNDEC